VMITKCKLVSIFPFRISENFKGGLWESSHTFLCELGGIMN